MTSGGGAQTAPFSVFLTPARIIESPRNGSSTSAIITANVISGSPDFTYLWESDSGDISIQSPTSESTRVSSSGFNEAVEATITLTVTDSDNNEATGMIPVTFFFGDGR